jgi:ABC-type antimicrobial peptide transport system permease subunit
MLVNTKELFSALAWTSYAFIAGGLLAFLPSAIGLVSKFIYNLNLSVQSIKYFLIYVINDFLRYFLFSGSITCIIGFILLIFALRIQKVNYINKNREDRK